MMTITRRGPYNTRRTRNAVFMGLSVAATAFGLSFLAIILGTLLYQGFSAIDLQLFTNMTPPPPGVGGGLLNPIVGSLIMTGIAVVVGTPIGILAGTYLAEYGRHTSVAFVIRFTNDILLSAPSIVLGLFVYEVMVVTMGHFSALAGAFALATIVVPVVVRTTEGMLLLIPNTLREAAAALGAPRSVVIAHITWRAARAGIITGGLLAVARISGETAPLLFTALNNQFWSTDVNGPMASLPVVIFQFAMSPYEGWHKLAWAGAVLITMAVLLLSILARVIGAQTTQRRP
jgi:phosphate transport system permease protein